ncbi:DUF805 domain-containing protein [Streptomyces polygonati]|uniref:DUF805 domain-containing protein n=1 Tax=Streptomyces polygonati TaxID=1617087 RepID=A0ABV8HZW0_9ACTN
MQWYIDVLKKYAVFSGRARRQEYWMYFLFNCIAIAVLFVIGLVIHTQIPYLIYALGVILPSLGVSVRRLHDTGKSGWFILLGIIPLVGGIILLVFTCLEGDAGDNAYGPNPKQGPNGAQYGAPPQPSY